MHLMTYLRGCALGLILFPASVSLPATLVLDDFESEDSLTRWSGPVSISKEQASHGHGSLKIDLDRGGANSLTSERLPADWSGYELLLFDIYNPTGRVQIGSIQMYDEIGSDEEAARRGDAFLGSRDLFLNRGWNHIEFLLKKAWVSRGTRPLALEGIRRFRLQFRGIRGTLYLDNLRLVSGEEEAGTKSRTGPWDCRVLIDNRLVYPSLVGPIEYGDEVAGLKRRAEVEIARLKREVHLAKAQGLQTLYWEIPLVTADVGIGIRSKMAWFQGEREQKEILNYVIDSCRTAAGSYR
jgi:hypothetical protein